MKLKCIICGNEFEGRSDAQYCSTKCRVAAQRGKEKPKEHLGQITGKLVKDMNAEDLKYEIAAYEGTDWTESSEFAELMFRLKTWSVERLKKEKYNIPTWKLNNKDMPKHLEDAAKEQQ